MKATAQKDYELARALRTPEGKFAVGQTIMEPFKEGRDYVAIGRRVLYVDHVPQGAPMWYDRDPQWSAVTISQRGAVAVEEIYGTRVVLEPFAIATLVRIPALEVAVRRYDTLNRSQVRARAEMAEQEDLEMLAALETAATSTTTANSVTTNSTADSRGNYLTESVLASAYAEVEDERLLSS